MEDAKAVIKRTARPGYYAENEVAGYAEYMRHTDALDRADRAKGSFMDMFRGTNLRRTEIQMGVWVIQQWNGNAITNLTTEFLQAAGMSTTFSFDFTIISNSLSIVGVAVSWVLLRYMGRRPIYVWGIMSIVILNMLIGILGCLKQTTQTAMGLGVLMTLVNFSFHCNLGEWLLDQVVNMSLAADTLRPGVLHHCGRDPGLQTASAVNRLGTLRLRLLRNHRQLPEPLHD
jgi:SP family general alpha glucoside:H+ symporter-like MFS transporter